MSLKDQLLAARAPTESVEVPGVGTYSVRVMSAGERDAFEAVQVRTPHHLFRPRLLALGLADEQGGRLFSDAELESLANVPATVAEPLVDAILRVNGLREKDEADLRKNSATGPDTGS